jgi:hypothetical protein
LMLPLLIYWYYDIDYAIIDYFHFIIDIDIIDATPLADYADITPLLIIDTPLAPLRQLMPHAIDAIDWYYIDIDYWCRFHWYAIISHYYATLHYTLFSPLFLSYYTLLTLLTLPLHYHYYYAIDIITLRWYWP